MTALTTEDLDPSLKIAVIGNGSIGKSSLIRRFTRNEYIENYTKTIGVQYAEREVEVPGEGVVRVMVWDTAGQEEFDKITQEYYRDADAIILAFSTTDRTSFDTLLRWRAKVQAVCDNIPMVLVQNKIDLVREGVVR
ncbi:Ras- protein Rab-23, partial [Rhizophlyctis rosea]